MDGCAVAYAACAADEDGDEAGREGFEGGIMCLYCLEVYHFGGGRVCLEGDDLFE